MRNLMIARSIIAAAALSGAAACVSGLQEIDWANEPLTVAVDDAELGEDTVITRFAFGSCNKETASQDIWSTIAGTDPQLFMMIGDNLYGDSDWPGDAQLSTFRQSYRTQAADPGFNALRRQVPWLVTWDDHDYGPNDSGGDFEYKRLSEQLFETFWGSPADVRSRPGIYHSVTVGPAGKRVQFIMLDTRYFRDDLVAGEFVENLGKYEPNTDPGASMLGAAQWQWLQDELAEPADLRVVVSSVQVLTEAHRWESWSRLPLERAKLLRMLGARNGGGIVLLSGDRHQGAIYKDTPAELGEEVWEFTSSSLNLAFVSPDASTREPDPRRVTPMVSEENFGVVDIDWAKRQVTFDLLSDKGVTFEKRTARF